MIETYSVMDQIYLIPTIKITYSKTLNGFYGIDLVWLHWGISLMWKQKLYEQIKSN